MASTDPATFPETTTWSLVTHPPTPGAAAQRTHAPAAVADVVHLYGLRIRVEQSDKQVQQALGWAEDHVRADLAIRRHWYLVCCAFALCWWAGAYPTVPARERSADAAPPPHEAPGQEALVVPMAGLGEKSGPAPQRRREAQHVAPGLTPRPSVAGAQDDAVALLACMVGQRPTARLATAPGLAVGGVRD